LEDPLDVITVQIDKPPEEICNMIIEDLERKHSNYK
jgi:hypothetical protein